MSRTAESLCTGLAFDASRPCSPPQMSTGAAKLQEMENEKTFEALFGLQYPRSPLPNNRTANALVLIDGGLDCESLSSVLLKENLRLIRLVKSKEHESPSSSSSSAVMTCEAREFSFAEPQFVATIIIDESDGNVFRVHISEPVSTAMSNCDIKLVDYFRALVMNLISRMTGRTMKIVKETFSGERWQTCVPCLMECPNIRSFLRHAQSAHDLVLPTEFDLPTTCQSVSFGPLLILKSESRNCLHILRTLVSLKLVVTSELSDLDLPAPTNLPQLSEGPETAGVPPADRAADSNFPGPSDALHGHTRPNADLLRVMAEAIKGIHCDAHYHFIPVCSDCNDLLSAKLGRTKELTPFLARLPDLVSLMQPKSIPPPLPHTDLLLPNSQDAPPVVDSATLSLNNVRVNNKTLKCPMCNWTYKYRETLEQHWRDKHPDLLHGSSDADLSAGRRSCAYCQTGSQHPKLSKGEIYPCGYAAYHCHYCGYKTNTKGNLEIHKQSEKHLVNVQKHGRLQNLPPVQSRSEGFINELTASSPQFIASQYLEHHMKQQQQQQQLQLPMTPAPLLGTTDCDRFPESVPTEFNDRSDFLRCFICGSFATGSLKALIDHVNLPREVSEDEYIVRMNDPQIVYCKLCPYKTFVKANFSVHCNTEKHRQKVNLLAHIYSGDRKRHEGSEWPLRLSNMSPVQILCTACQSIETSIASVERHLQSESHIDAFNTLVFVSENVRELYGRSINEANFAFECRLCAKKISNISELRTHITSNGHIMKTPPQVPRNCCTKPEVLKTILSISMDAKSQKFGMKVPKVTLLQCPCCADNLADNASLQAHLRKNHFIDESCVDAMCQLATKVNAHNPASCEQQDEGKIDDLKENLKISNIIDDVCDAFASEHAADEDIYTCDVCYKDVCGSAALFDHMRQMNHAEIPNAETSKFLCWKKGCNQYFNSHAARDKHLRKIHTTQYQTENSIYRLNCRYCGLAFRLEETYNRHVMLHEKLSRYFGVQACTICHAQIHSPSDLRAHVFKAHAGLNHRNLKKKPEHDSDQTAGVLETKSPTPNMSTVPTQHIASPALNTKPAATGVTCMFCQTVSPSLAEFRAHEQSVDHYHRVTTLLVSAYNMRNHSNGMGFMPLPLGVGNINQMSNFLTALPTFMPQSLSSPLADVAALAQMSAAVRPKEENGADGVKSGDLDGPAALLAMASRLKTSPTERQITPTTSPVNHLGLAGGRPSSKEATTPVAAHASLGTHQVPPTTPNSASSSSSMPTPGQAGLISPAFSDPPAIIPGMLSPLGMNPVAPHSFPAQPAFNPVIVPPRPSPSPATPQEPGRRRGRTRISEEQLQVLREHFHINSPPSDNLIREISLKTGLDLKVIKHWYRNTLFKERQRDKDNPYNFNNPPSTSLNLEEYERTGRIEVRNAQAEAAPAEALSSSSRGPNSETEDNENNDFGTKTENSEVSNPQRRKRPLEENSHDENTEMKSHESQTQKRLRIASPTASETSKSMEESLSMYQLECLMTAYKKDSSLSSDQLDQLAGEIGLSEERVSNWFSKARADDCSNLNMLADVAGVAEAEAIVAVRCPYCQIIFRLRSQLADHLQSAHPDKPAVDAESLPDGSVCLGMSNTLDARPWLSANQESESINTSIAVAAQATQQRRARTSITTAQSALLRYIYSLNKNPTVTESKRLSDKLSLNRRVVQVWFQNQRAQEKKRSRGNRIAISSLDCPNSPSSESVDWLPMDTKVLCAGCMNGDTDESHIFSDDHLDAISSYIEARINSESPGRENDST